MIESLSFATFSIRSDNIYPPTVRRPATQSPGDYARVERDENTPAGEIIMVLYDRMMFALRYTKIVSQCRLVNLYALILKFYYTFGLHNYHTTCGDVCRRFSPQYGGTTT